MSESYLAVLDRFTEEIAVVLIEDSEAPVNQLDLPVEQVPPEGRHEGAVLEARFIEGELEDLTYRPEEETSRRKSAEERFNRLSNRLPDEE